MRIIGENLSDLLISQMQNKCFQIENKNLGSLDWIIEVWSDWGAWYLLPQRKFLRKKIVTFNFSLVLKLTSNFLMLSISCLVGSLCVLLLMVVIVLAGTWGAGSLFISRPSFSILKWSLGGGIGFAEPFMGGGA